VAPDTIGWDRAEALAGALKREAREIGFAAVGIADAQPTKHGPFYREWLRRGRHGEMAYLARPEAVQRREDLSETWPEVRSVLVVADAYAWEDAPGVPEDPSLGVVARYARGADYHRVVVRKLERLRVWLAERLDLGERPGRPYVDTGPVLERDLARRAGIGWFGRNTMIIDPRHGSYFVLGALLLELDLPADPPFEADRCGSCDACLDACPTGALRGRQADGAPVIDATRCISYLTIELDGPIPVDLRSAMGNRVFGCDICQEVCPWNARMPQRIASESRYAARAAGALPSRVEALSGDEMTADAHPGTDAPSLIALMDTVLDPGRWASYSRASPLRRAGRGGFGRNVAVALGNWGDPAAVPVLVRAARDPEALLRRHAAWALGQVGSSEALIALSARLAEETDPAVRSEIEASLH
jgi:epoxyqueuosine reductase